MTKKYWKAAFINFLICALLWLLSMPLVSVFLLRGLEQKYQIPQNLDGDVIVLLGGGSYLKSQDISGIGTPAGNTLERIVTAVRLQKKLDLPIIVSSGKVFEHVPSEAPIIKRFLVELGVPSDKIIIEDKSKDTLENARYTKVICEKMGFKKPILVTSAYHMRRSVLLFKKAGMDVIPFPSNFRTSKVREIHWDAYMPSGIENTHIALIEYIGLLFYSVVL
ncbi:MAG: YdcF family protein [Nitrospirae bacterium]|nr:YdcF family protein [Nitrospirota bacterium]